jgi:P27 family predicted phage terminase small subunit
MARGRPPKPAGLRLVEGTDRKGRTGRTLDRSKEVIAPDGEITPPYPMSGLALEVWKQTVDDLEAMGVASPADRYQIAGYVESAVLFQRASALVRDGELVDQGAHGQVAAKATVIQRHAALMMLRFAAEFGLTPSARMRVEVPGDVDRSGRPNPFA